MYNATNLVPNDASNRLIYCIYCLPKYEFKSNNDFITHLRENHCKLLNNTLLICEYGPNKKCLYLKSEPIEASIYEDHCLNRHLIDKSLQEDRISLRSNASSDRLALDYTSSSLPFASNLTAILSDPKKDRHRVNQLFTKTWGYDFTDNPTQLQYVTKSLPSINITDFRSYLIDIDPRFHTHAKNVDLANEINLKSYMNNNMRHDAQEQLDQIPKIFYEHKFSLESVKTFNEIVYNWKLFEVGVLGEHAQRKQARKGLCDKLTQYLDLIEIQISKQISTKANTFFSVLSSQEQVQEQITKTCGVVKCLRKNLQNLDKSNVFQSIKLLQLVAIRSNYKKITKQLELISSIHQTQRAIQSHLALSEYSGSLDLIKVSQDVLNHELAGIHSLRHFGSQLNEIETFIDKMLHDEFIKYIESDLSRDFSDGDEVFNGEKLVSLLFAILRTKNTKFMDLFKEEIMIYIKSTVKQTVVMYVAQNDDNCDDFDDDGKTLMDRVRQLVYQEFLLLLSRVLKNIKIMLTRVKSITSLVLTIIKRDLISEGECIKIEVRVRDLLVESTQYAQERLVKLLDGKNRENIYEKLNNEEFISLTNILEQFIIDFDQIAEKKTSTLKAWLQNQSLKYLIKFHNERKEKLTLALDTEGWKVASVSSEMQNLVDNLRNLTQDTFNLTVKKTETNQRQNDFLAIDNQKYVVLVSAVVLVKIMIEYCQLTVNLSSLTFDIMTRLIEIFKIFNSKTSQLILGGGASQVSGLTRITVRHLGLMFRSLELEIYFLPLVKEKLLEKIPEKLFASSVRQFDQLLKDYQDHMNELNKKILIIVDEVFIRSLVNYEVKAPVPSLSFKNICQQVSKVHELLNDVLRNETMLSLFANIHERFKSRLKLRLKELNVINDGGPQHALVFSDMSYYLTQFKNLNGLHLIPLNFEDIWTI